MAAGPGSQRWERIHGAGCGEGLGSPGSVADGVVESLQTKAVGADLLNSWVMHERFLNPCVQTAETAPCEHSFLPAKYVGISIDQKSKGPSDISSGWWFGTLFIFPWIRNNHPN